MKSCEDITISWLKHIQQNGKRIVRNSELDLLQEYGNKYFGRNFNLSTYERKFRLIRKQWPHRFEDVSDDYPTRTEKTWKIKPKDHESEPNHT